jgi:surfeit locus 1 family protein
MKRAPQIIAALGLGLAGCAVLIGLGVWQVQRLAWKTAILDRIEARIAAAPVPVPEAPDPVRDAYLSVAAEGRIDGPAIRVLVSQKDQGAGCRIVQAFETGDRRLLLDRGFVRIEGCKAAFPGGPVQVTGNLHWPDEIDSYTPAPEANWRDGGLWFARDLPAMAEALGTEPVLIVAREPTGDSIAPLPLGSEGIPNDHLNYAITWFSLALVWAGMTVLMLSRISRRAEQDEKAQ